MSVRSRSTLAIRQTTGEHVLRANFGMLSRKHQSGSPRWILLATLLFPSAWLFSSRHLAAYSFKMSWEFRSWVGGNARWWIRRIVRGAHNQTTLLLHEGSIFERNLNIIRRFFLSCGRYAIRCGLVKWTHEKMGFFLFGERTACQIPIESRLTLATMYVRCVFESKTVDRTTNARQKSAYERTVDGLRKFSLESSDFWTTEGLFRSMLRNLWNKSQLYTNFNKNYNT